MYSRSNLHFEMLRVLVVDDEPMMRKLITFMLSRMGVEDVLLADSGPEALKILQSHTVDVITCDYNMEPMNGTEMVRKLRRDPSHPARRVPIVMVTANVELEVVISARDSGANEYVTKPLSANALKSRLVRALTDDRPFIDDPSYAGPDRRRPRIDLNYTGPRRRVTDVESSAPVLGEEDSDMELLVPVLGVED